MSDRALAFLVFGMWVENCRYFQYALSLAFPEWKFVALNPSLSMLDVCRERVKNPGILDRCEFVHGYVHDLSRRAEFDAALSILLSELSSAATEDLLVANMNAGQN